MPEVRRIYEQRRPAAVSQRTVAALRDVLARDPDLVADLIESDASIRRHFEKARPELRGKSARLIAETLTGRPTKETVRRLEQIRTNVAAGERALAKLNRIEAEKAVDCAINDGRLPIEQRDTTVRLFERDASGAKAFLEGQPPDGALAARNRSSAAAAQIDDTAYEAHARHLGVKGQIL